MQSFPEGPDPVGVVLPIDTDDPACGSRGRVVFAMPVSFPKSSSSPSSSC